MTKVDCLFAFLSVEMNKIRRLLREDLDVPTSTCADWRWGWRRRMVYPAWAWADVPWHGQNKAFGFFAATLSIEAAVSGFTCFLCGGLRGQALWPLHLLGVSRRQRQSLQRRTADGGWGETLHSSRAADELCNYRNNFSYVSINLWPLATLHNDLCPKFRHVLTLFTTNHGGQKHHIDPDLFSILIL